MKKIVMEIGIGDLIQVEYKDDLPNSGEQMVLGIVEDYTDEKVYITRFGYVRSMNEENYRVQYGFNDSFKPHYVKNIEILHIPKCKERQVFNYEYEIE